MIQCACLVWAVFGWFHEVSCPAAQSSWIFGKPSEHVAMEVHSYVANRVTLAQRYLPRQVSYTPDRMQRRPSWKRFRACSLSGLSSFCSLSSLPVFLFTSKAFSKSRPKVSRKSIRDAREAIRQCLRENRTMPVLQALPEDSLQQILDKMTRMELKPGEHIFRKGEPVDAVYVVESGELSVVKPLRQGEEDLRCPCAAWVLTMVENS